MSNFTTDFEVGKAVLWRVSIKEEGARGDAFIDWNFREAPLMRKQQSEALLPWLENVGTIQILKYAREPHG